MEDTDAEIELVKLRFTELLARKAKAEHVVRPAPAKASNWTGEGEIPSPVGFDPTVEAEARLLVEGVTSSSSSGDAVPPPPTPLPPLPPPDKNPDVPDTLQRRLDIVVDECARNAEAGRSASPPPLRDLDAPQVGPADVAEDADMVCQVCTDDFGDEWLIDDGSHARRSKLRRDALSAAHLLTHQPKNPYCWACVRAKMMRRYAKRKRVAPTRVPLKFGDSVTADHLLAQSEESMGLFGERDALVIVDRYTEYVDAFPLKSKSAKDALRAFNEYFG